ncbi:hypothetical protein BS78_05G205300 [Paspalum vaginatum]|nr:hypothetical protein BS78_05G205300 [Paspalum vaginatum]
MACALISSNLSSSIFFSFLSLSVFERPCCANRSFTLVCHSPKFPIPSNFTTLNLGAINTIRLLPQIAENPLECLSFRTHMINLVLKHPR